MLASLIRPLAILGLFITLASNSANSHPSFNAFGERMTLEHQEGNSALGDVASVLGTVGSVILALF